MKVLFDTNIILDVLLDREPFSRESSILLTMVERSEIMGFICATTVTTLYYLIAKALGPNEAEQHIRSLLTLFTVAPVNRAVLENGLSAEFKDFEDAVLHEAARHAGVEYIVTRNIADFKKSRLPAFQPKELINALDSLNR